MDQSALAVKLQLPRDAPGVIARRLDLLGGESDLRKVRAFEYPLLHRLVEYDHQLLGHRTALYGRIDFVASPLDVKASFPAANVSPERWSRTVREDGWDRNTAQPIGYGYS
jgi:hypothetical protein